MEQKNWRWNWDIWNNYHLEVGNTGLDCIKELVYDEKHQSGRCRNTDYANMYESVSSNDASLYIL